MPRAKKTPRKMGRGLLRRPLKITNHLSRRERMTRRVLKTIKMTRKMERIIRM